MGKLPNIFKEWSTQTWYVLISGLFFLLFGLSYRPFGMDEYLSMGRDRYYFSLSIMMCIVMGSLAISRSLLPLLKKRLCTTWWSYIAYCLLELMAVTFWFGLYVSLMRHDPYLGTLKYCALYSYGVLIIPYAIITLIYYITALQRVQSPVEESELVRFYDNTKQLKLVVSRSAILYINAEENYVRIHYQDADEHIKDFQLRASMKSIEPVAAKHGLFRCQRSYFINPTRVKALRKDSHDQITAELNVSGISIPVSRRLYAELTSLI